MKKIILYLILLNIISLPSYSIGKWILVDDAPFKNCSPNLNAIDCADSNHCIIVGEYWLSDNATCRVTTDGGKTWLTTIKDTMVIDGDTIFNKNMRAYDLSYPDTTFCLINSSYGYYWRSKDKGLTWKLNKIDNYNSAIGYINMFDKDRGSMASNTDLFLTDNGGDTWRKIYYKEIDSTIIDTITSIGKAYICDTFVPEPGVVIVLFINTDTKIRTSWLAKSEDWGNTWEIGKKTKFPDELSQIFFFNKNDGYACGGPKVNTGIYKGILYYTSDGGKSWEIRMDTILKEKYGFHKIKFADRMHGIILGNDFIMFRTTDGGLTWFRDSSFTIDYAADYLWDFAYPDTNTLFGILCHFDKTYKYIDEPVSVEEPPKIENKEQFNVLTVPNPTTGLTDIYIESEYQGNLKLIVYTINGKEVLSANIDKKSYKVSIPLNLRNEANGVYQYNLLKGNEVIYSGIISVQR